MPERKETDFLHEIAFNEPNLRSNSAAGTTQMRAVKAESIDALCRDAGKGTRMPMRYEERVLATRGGMEKAAEDQGKL
jgi:hypothetical protein